MFPETETFAKTRVSAHTTVVQCRIKCLLARLRSIVMSMTVYESFCVSVCGSVCLSVYLSARISRNHTSDLCQVFMRVAYVRGSVRLRHVYDRPHRLSPGRVFFLNENALSAGKGDGSAQRGRSMLSMIALLTKK